MDTLAKIVLVFLLCTFMIFFACAAVFMPFSLVAEKRCLEAGYPHTSFTYDFDVYCSTLQGDVSIKLEKQP